MSMQVELRGISARALEAWLRAPDLSHPMVRMSSPAPTSFRHEGNYEDEMQSVLRELSGGAQPEASFDEDLDSQLLLDAGLEPTDFDDPLSAGDYRELEPTLVGHANLAALREALLGGVEHGDDVGYGPMRYHSPAGVRGLLEGLLKIDADTVSAIEPWLPELVVDIRAYFEGASKKGGAVAVFVV